MNGEEDVTRDELQPDEQSAVVEGGEDVAALRQALVEEKEKAGRYLANWQRAQADLENYRKRAEQERSETVKFGTTTLILDLLPVLDDLERALASVPDGLVGDEWVNGIELVYRKFRTVLEERGVSEIKALGGPFDPYYHEAVMQGEGEEGMVVEEFQKGYMVHDRVVRPARVKVGAGGEESANEQPEEESNA